MEPEVLVLLSGGVDSAACLAFYLELGRPPMGLFVDYGQPARRDEQSAAEAIARHYRVPLTVTRWHGQQPKTVGRIPARNLFLLAVAAMERARGIRVVALGLHAGSSYGYCSAAFVHAATAVLQQSGEHDFTVSVPFIDWPKGDVYSYAARQSVPFALTYSCEAADGPCGACLSCGDRRGLDARA